MDVPPCEFLNFLLSIRFIEKVIRFSAIKNQMLEFNLFAFMVPRMANFIYVL